MQASSQTAFNQKKRIATLWLLAIAFLLTIVFSRPLWGDGTEIHETVEVAGLVLVFFAMLGRLWSILYIGAHKNRSLVTAGPYSMTRNPLYFFSLVGIAGIGLMFGSALLTAALTLSCYAVFRYTAMREAAYLASLFGEAYDRYAASTPLLLPNPRLYSGPAEVTFSQAALTTTFFDCLFLIALFPLIEGVEMLQAGGYLTALIAIP
ncbi:MAG: isoprenylcysteine carboxylmethyltransferase family protein [Shinella sp.]|nr:isoprenylcysteine carboxylmethyltransferase family protein [Shinella sp.]